MNSIVIPNSGIIDEPGNYHLEGNIISSEMFALKIEANNVYLNLNRHTIVTNVENKSKTTFGIYAVDCENLNIQNGSIQGSAIGVHAPYNKNFSANNLLINKCLHMGMNIGGSFPKVTQCIVSEIGGFEEEAYAVGINSSDAENACIAFNRIENIYRQQISSEKTGEGVSLLLGADSNSCKIYKNTFINQKYEPRTIGAWIVGRDNIIYDNFICNFQYGGCMKDSIVMDNVILLKESHGKTCALALEGGSELRNFIQNYSLDVGDLYTLFP